MISAITVEIYDRKDATLIMKQLFNRIKLCIFLFRHISYKKVLLSVLSGVPEIFWHTLVGKYIY